MVEKGKEKVTWIKLETESLKSEKNLMKIKKALFIFPQIRDQTYDEENNTVTIKVVCCSPEKIMDKLCSKGRGAIKHMKTIDMSKEAEKPKEPEKSESIPAQTGPSSQPVTIQQGYPICMYNGPLYVWTKPNWYLERPVYDSYRDYIQEESSSCRIC